MLRGRIEPATRGVHHRHGVFHRDGLRSAGLDVALGASKHRQDDRLLADQKMRAVELGAEVHGEIELAHARPATLRVGQRHGKIASETDQDLRSAIVDCLHRSDRVMAVMSWRLEAEGAFDALKHWNIGLFGDADRSIALHVGVTAQRANAGARFAEIAPQKQQVCDLLHVGCTAAVLGDAHAV